MNIFNFFTDFIENLTSVASDVLQWFTTPINIPLIDYSIAPVWLMFGSGLIMFLGVLIIKAIL